MIAGTAVGAGMLGIPLITAEIGFSSSAIMTLLVWMYMFITSLLLMEVSVSLKEKGGFVELAKAYLPPYGKNLITFLFLFLYGILLIAYVSAGSEILGLKFSESVVIKSLFPLILFTFLLLRTKRVVTLISVLTIPMWVYFALFYFYGVNHIEFSRLLVDTPSKSYLAVPILFGAFGFHNVIPSITTYLDYDKKSLRKAIFLGSMIPCILYLLWQFLILGMVDAETLSLAKAKGIPVVTLLGGITQNSIFATAGAIFAFFAILTSALGVGLSVVRFIDKRERSFTILGVILIPTLVAFTNPGIFLRALSFAGGVGESILNGIIPVWLYVVYKNLKSEMNQKLKICSFFLFLIASIVVIIELGNLI